METKTITPELKEHFKTIFLDVRRGHIDRLKWKLRISDNVENDLTNIVEYSSALSSVCDLAYRLDDLSGLITDSLRAGLVEDKRRGSLTEQGISRSFELVQMLINIASYKGTLDELAGYYHDKTALIESVDINELGEYVDTLFKSKD